MHRRTPASLTRSGLLTFTELALAGLALVLLLTGCTVPAEQTTGAPVPGADDPLPAADLAALEAVFADTFLIARGDFGAFTADSDPRVAWPLVDLLRFHEVSSRAWEVQAALSRVADVDDDVDWVHASDVLLAADLPAFPGYLDLKRRQFLQLEPDWAPFFTADSDLDFRQVQWGGVRRDGIPALDDPAVVGADEGWIPDEEEVFGVVVDGQARAYPRRVMEAHELVNDTLGGVRLTLPYCTLCGTATAYALDGLPEGDATGEDPQAAPAMRTSGLLNRSNKLMYDLATESLFEQFAGVAVSGPLRGTSLPRITVTAATWAAWRAAHPDTTLVAQDASPIDYQADFLDGRDDDGPIFPVGDVDPRLPVHARVVGTETPSGTAVAFAEEAAVLALGRGEDVVAAGVRAVLDQGVLTLRDADDASPLPSFVAFWFAWSQFRPEAVLWDGT